MLFIPKFEVKLKKGMNILSVLKFVPIPVEENLAVLLKSPFPIVSVEVFILFPVGLKIVTPVCALTIK